MPQYQNKAFPYRIIFYPLAATITYILWTLFKRKYHKKRYIYPYFIDICFTLVVTADLLGNTLNLYYRIFWWDDAMHLLLTIPWVLIVGCLIRNRREPRWVLAAVVIAWGSTSHIIWELLEYISFIQSNPVESLSAYQDTMGDLLLSTIGTAIATFISIILIKRDVRHSKSAK